MLRQALSFQAILPLSLSNLGVLSLKVVGDSCCGRWVACCLLRVLEAELLTKTEALIAKTEARGLLLCPRRKCRWAVPAAGG